MVSRHPPLVRTACASLPSLKLCQYLLSPILIFSHTLTLSITLTYLTAQPANFDLEGVATLRLSILINFEIIPNSFIQNPSRISSKGHSWL